MSLREYKTKRNFRRTREPAGRPGRRRAADRPFFVVQKHDATRLHYDFRLSLKGVLKSWAVPKGFPMKRGDRRLAVQVEDHPIDYARFEGTIPEGSYGAGTVMVWDQGAYEVKGDDPARAIETGKLHLVLKGKKLNGEWTLVRMRGRGDEEKPQWLLLKSGSDARELSARKDDQSVLTGRSLKRIAEDNDAQWQSDRIAKRAATPLASAVARRRPAASHKGAAVNRTRGGAGRTQRSRSNRRLPATVSGGVTLDLKRLPPRTAEFVQPMNARLADSVPRGEDWIYEIKFDGVRALAIKDRDGVQLISRNAKDFTARFPEITDALKGVAAREAILDGEIVALDAHGRSSFQLLQAHQTPGIERPPIFYYVFDAIQLDGKDLTGLALTERKTIARFLTADLPGPVRFSDSIQADSDRVLKEMQMRGLEGLIAKRQDSRYESGRRSGAWVKFKWTNEQEFVIGGYTSPKGTRSHFGAILVGYYQGKKLLFASKVGTGFDQRLLKSLHDRFQMLLRSGCPFANLPEKSTRFGGLTASEMRRCTWLEPRLVCQIRFAEWTRDGHLRQPVFLGLREDKRSREVVREGGRRARAEG